MATPHSRPSTMIGAATLARTPDLLMSSAAAPVVPS
jgi:hypothetical protein